MPTASLSINPLDSFRLLRKYLANHAQQIQIFTFNFEHFLNTSKLYKVTQRFVLAGYTGALPYSKSARVDANYSDTTRYALNRRMCENMRHQRRLAASDDTKRNVGQHFLIGQ